MSPTDAAGRPAGEVAGEAGRQIRLARWTVTSGSNVQSRGAVVVEAGDHRWEASAEGNGPVDALFRAVDRALTEVLTGHPRLIAYDIHALAEGPDSEGRVALRIAPPSAAAGRRARGRYPGEKRGTNIIQASVEAYIEAINAMLAEEHWAGAAEAAGDRRRARAGARRAPDAEYDEASARHDTTSWFDR